MEKGALLQRVEGLIDQTQGVAFVVPEDTGFFSVDDDLVRRVRELIQETVELMRDLTRVYDAESEAHGESDDAQSEDDGFLRELGAQISSELAAREVSNLAFVARGQLMEMQDSLHGALERRQVWAVASSADSGLRHAGKALIAIESAICEYEGLPARDRRWVDLADSLETRRLYSQFRRAILRAGDGSADDTVRTRLQGAATRIAILRNLEIYPFLRIDDRLTIRHLQKRIAAWLSPDEGSEEGAGGEEAGERLWEDLVSFARLLLKVNDREELVEHDRQVATSLHRMIFSRQQQTQGFTETQLKELERLVGRDDELDLLVLNAADHSVKDFKEPLERILNHLQRPFAGSAGLASTFFGEE